MGSKLLEALAMGKTLVDSKDCKYKLDSIVLEDIFEGSTLDLSVEQLHEDFKIYVDPKDAEIETLRLMLKKRDEQLEAYKNPPRKSRKNIGIDERNTILDMNKLGHSRPDIIRSADVSAPVVSRVIAGTHSICKVTPVWKDNSEEGE